MEELKLSQLEITMLSRLKTLHYELTNGDGLSDEDMQEYDDLCASLFDILPISN